MKAVEQYFHMVLTFKSVVETLVCDHSKESYWAVLFITLQGGSNNVDTTL